jgi:hypothetical protein
LLEVHESSNPSDLPNSNKAEQELAQQNSTDTVFEGMERVVASWLLAKFSRHALDKSKEFVGLPLIPRNCVELDFPFKGQTVEGSNVLDHVVRGQVTWYRIDISYWWRVVSRGTHVQHAQVIARHIVIITIR